MESQITQKLRRNSAGPLLRTNGSYCEPVERMGFCETSHNVPAEPVIRSIKKVPSRKRLVASQVTEVNSLTATGRDLCILSVDPTEPTSNLETSVKKRKTKLVESGSLFSPGTCQYITEHSEEPTLSHVSPRKEACQTEPMDPTTDINRMYDPDPVNSIKNPFLGPDILIPNQRFQDKYIYARPVRHIPQLPKASQQLAYGLMSHPDYIMFEHATSFNKKPSLSYASMVVEAFELNNNRLMTLGEIYKCISNKYPYFRTAPPGWKVWLYVLATCKFLLSFSRILYDTI